MPKYLLVLSLSAFSAASLWHFPVAIAAGLEGKIEKLAGEGANNADIDHTKTTSAKSAKLSPLLQGGIKDDAFLHPSLKLLPGKAGAATGNNGLNSSIKHDVAPLGADMLRGPGGVLYAPGQPMPYVVPSVSGRSGNIPPISTYTLIPQNSIIQVAPGYGISSTPGINGSASYPSLYSSTPPVSVKGVTSYVEGWQLPSVSRHDIPVQLPTSGTGIAVFQPGYEAGKLTGDAPLVSLTGTTTPSSSGNGVSNFTPGGKVSFSTPGSGIVCWAPGYEVSVQTASFNKETLGGMWSTPAALPPQLVATQQSLPSIRTYIEAVPPMMATPLLLPGLKSDLSGVNLTWDQWYHRVAKAIYSRWQTTAVGAGQATVRLTVTNDRQLSCKVVDFTPAADVPRNVEIETVFREAALKSANDVSMFEIPEFPAGSTLERVTFDVQMRHTVDGAAGFTVAR